MKTIALIGSSQLAERLIYYFEETGFGNVAGMFDDFKEPGTLAYGKPILGKTGDMPKLYRKSAFDSAVIAVGYSHMAFRKQMYERITGEEIPVVTFIHPSSYIEKSATIGKGSIVLTCCTIDMHSEIGENVLLSSRSFISHHVRVGSHTYCGPSINLAGNSSIGDCCFLGVNSTVIDHVAVADYSICAAGAVVTKDVPAHVMVAGVPAQIKKRLNDVPT